MAGLYIHIPFCKSRCIYCGFYSTTAHHALRRDYVGALCEEIRLRGDYLHEPVSTVYLGGGTPSQLAQEEISKIFEAVYKYNKVDTEGAEITIECNPDDVTPEFAEFLAQSPVNRVSMGAQSFSEEMLRFAGRRHSAGQIGEAVERLRETGISNISIDLMFGFPGESRETWLEDIRRAVRLGVEHISVYSLMYEEGTPLYGMLESGRIRETDEETSLWMYETLIDELAGAGYEHYEISNFAKPDFRSRHNSSYWEGVAYSGIGSAAHSYDGTSRQWNVADVRKYIAAIAEGRAPAEREVLTRDMMFDDTVMTRLRTKEGIDLGMIRREFGKEYYDFLMREAGRHVTGGLLHMDESRQTLSLTRRGLFVSDSVMSDLMHV